ncbi:MAG TPA: hypothetical protein VF950_20350 [Planctomycetota bacterium]
MLGRVLSFSDPVIIKLLQENFIPLVGDDWYQRRRKDDVGKFFRKVVNQTWKAGDWESQGGGGNNRQGIYCFTPSGKMLTDMKNVGGMPREVEGILRRALRSWNELPEAERRAEAVEIPDPSLDPGYHRPVPPGALVLREYSRGLKRDAAGTLAIDDFTFQNTPVWAQRDRAWVLEAEWKAMIPATAKAGDVVELPKPLVQRLMRYHFVEALRGEAGQWEPKHVRASTLKLTVAAATDVELRLRLDGGVKLATDDAKVGLEGTLAGDLRVDRTRQAFTRFDVVLIADCWGALNPHNGVSREGRNPVGFSFELGTGAEVDRVPPQWARLLAPYLNP